MYLSVSVLSQADVVTCCIVYAPAGSKTRTSEKSSNFTVFFYSRLFLMPRAAPEAGSFNPFYRCHEIQENHLTSMLL